MGYFFSVPFRASHNSAPIGLDIRADQSPNTNAESGSSIAGKVSHLGAANDRTTPSGITRTRGLRGTETTATTTATTTA